MCSPEYHHCKGIVEEQGSLTFIQKIQYYNDKFSLSFARKFDRWNVQIWNLSFKVMENSLSRAIGLRAEGETFFKGGQLNIPNCAMFLKSVYRSISWVKENIA